MSPFVRRAVGAFALALMVAACATGDGAEGGGTLPSVAEPTTPETEVPAVETTTVETTPETEVPAVETTTSTALSTGVSGAPEQPGEEVLLVRQVDGDTARMFTVRPDGSDERDLTLPAPCGTDDRGCAVRFVLPASGGRSLIAALDHMFWYDSSTGDISHIAAVDEVLRSSLVDPRFVVASVSSGEQAVAIVADLDAGTTLEVPTDDTVYLVAELSDGVAMQTLRGPTIVVNTASERVVTLDDDLLAAPDQVRADGELVAAYDVGDDHRGLVIIDVDDPGAPSAWPALGNGVQFDWAGDRLVAVSGEDGVVEIVDESGFTELARLWPGEFLAASIVADPTGMFALVQVHSEEMVWYRIDIAAGRADEVVEVRGWRDSPASLWDPDVVAVDDGIDDDATYTQLRAVPIVPGPVVDVVATAEPSRALTWPIDDDRHFVRSVDDESNDASWILDLRTGTRDSVAFGREPRLSRDGSTMAYTAGAFSDVSVSVLPLDDPAAATTVVRGTAIDWMQR